MSYQFGEWCTENYHTLLQTETALIRTAVLGNDVKQVKALLEKNCDINTRFASEHRPTLLMTAAHFGYVDMVKLLLAENANVNTDSEHGATALLFASTMIQKEGVQQDEGVRCNPEDVFEIVKLLIENNADVHVPDNKGRTALSYFSEFPHSEPLQRILEEADINLNRKDRLGKTALMYACQGPNLSNVKILLHAGANPLLRDKGGECVVSRKGWKPWHGDCEAVFRAKAYVREFCLYQMTGFIVGSRINCFIPLFYYVEEELKWPNGRFIVDAILSFLKVEMPKGITEPLMEVVNATKFNGEKVRLIDFIDKKEQGKYNTRVRFENSQNINRANLKCLKMIEGDLEFFNNEKDMLKLNDGNFYISSPDWEYFDVNNLSMPASSYWSNYLEQRSSPWVSKIEEECKRKQIINAEPLMEIVNANKYNGTKVRLIDFVDTKPLDIHKARVRFENSQIVATIPLKCLKLIKGVSITAGSHWNNYIKPGSFPWVPKIEEEYRRKPIELTSLMEIQGAKKYNGEHVRVYKVIGEKYCHVRLCHIGRNKVIQIPQECLIEPSEEMQSMVSYILQSNLIKVSPEQMKAPTSYTVTEIVQSQWSSQSCVAHNEVWP